MRLGLPSAGFARLNARLPARVSAWRLDRALLLPLAAWSLLQGGCGNDGDGSRSGGPLGGRLRECGLLGAGDVRARDRSELAACIAACRVEASCDELSTRYCSQTSIGQLLSCEAACFEPLECGSGKGSYTLLERCDGRRQCGDGTDERGCDVAKEPPRYCEAGGERIWAFQVCNGTLDCKDGTDESGCPPASEQFVCKGNIPQRVLKSQVCDLVIDCLDGSDEAASQGCAQLTCERAR